MVLNPAGSTGVFVCETVEEIARPRGVIPHVLPGDNKYLTEFTVTDGVPAEAARGGAETLYPEYRAKLATLPIPRPPAARTPPQTPPR